MPSQIEVCNRALSVIGTRSSVGGGAYSLVASLTESTPEAQACTLHFEGACRALLRLAPWSFARATIQGALLAAAPGTPENLNGTVPLPLVPISTANPAGSMPLQIVPWLYEYAWPQSCVRLRQVKPPVNSPSQGTNTVPIWPGINMASPGFGGSGSLDNRVPYQISLDADSAGNQIKVILTNIEYALIVYTALVDDPNLWDDEFTEAYIFMLASHLVGALVGDKQLDKALYEKAAQAAITARAVDGNEQPLSPSHTPDWIKARTGWPVTGEGVYPMGDDSGYYPGAGGVY
ncbi:MAG: hypothetical protein ABSF90_03615 [Syntrophobacteraceae bacterium]